MNKTYATGFVNPKTTALFFDKLFIPASLVSSHYGMRNRYYAVPKEVRFTYKEELDDWYDYLYEKYSVMDPYDLYSFDLLNKQCGSEIFLGRKKIYRAKLKKGVRKRLINAYNNCGDFHLSFYRNNFLIFVAQKLKQNFNIDLIPIFFDKTDFEKALEKEKAIRRLMKQVGMQSNNEIEANVYEAIITCDRMIDEDELSWEQVLEIRKDKIERVKLKRFRAWADSNFDNYTKEQITDTIGKTYNDYIAALQKHGVNTLVGSMSTVLPEATIGVLSTWGGNIVNYVGLGLQIAVGALGKTVVDYTKIHKQPIAYYYDIVRKTSQKNC